MTLRIDSDVLEWFKSQGRGYQTQINTLLRAYMEAHR
ncbi:BrnA antitoxin family protein [Nostoc sp. DSM 114159]